MSAYWSVCLILLVKNNWKSSVKVWFSLIIWQNRLTACRRQLLLLQSLKRFGEKWIDIIISLWSNRTNESVQKRDVNQKWRCAPIRMGVILRTELFWPTSLEFLGNRSRYIVQRLTNPDALCRVEEAFSILLTLSGNFN